MFLSIRVTCHACLDCREKWDCHESCVSKVSSGLCSDTARSQLSLLRALQEWRHPCQGWPVTVMTTWSLSVTATVTQGRSLSRRMSRAPPAPWLRLRAPTWRVWQCPACACAAEASRPGGAQLISVSQSWEIKWAVKGFYVRGWMRLGSWLALCAYWGSGSSEATSGCDNEQYEHNDQMWRVLTSDLIDHCCEHDIDSD